MTDWTEGNIHVRLQVGEIIEAVRKESDILKKQQILWKHNTPGLVQLLRVQYGRDVFSALPMIRDKTTDAPPYKRNPAPVAQTEARLMTSWKIFRIFRDRNIKPKIVENRFIQLLEGLHPSEADMLLDAMTGKLETGLTEEKMRAVLPAVFEGHVVKHPHHEVKIVIDAGDGKSVKAAVTQEVIDATKEIGVDVVKEIKEAVEAQVNKPIEETPPALVKPLSKRAQAKLDYQKKLQEKAAAKAAAAQQKTAPVAPPAPPKPVPVVNTPAPEDFRMPTAAERRAAMLGIAADSGPLPPPLPAAPAPVSTGHSAEAARANAIMDKLAQTRASVPQVGMTTASVFK